MTRQTAAQLLRDELDKQGLKDWHIRLTNDLKGAFLGLCSYKDKCIILNAHHIDIHPDPDIIDTIKHEVAHALTPSHNHDNIWAAKALELGCLSTNPCSNLSLSPDIIDAIRSGAEVVVTFEEEVIRRPKYQVTRLQDKCEVCGKVAKELRSSTITNNDPIKPDEKFIFLECGHLIVKKIPKGTPFQTLVSNGERTDIKSCKHKWSEVSPKNQCILCGEFKLYDFQIEGARFIEAALAMNKGAGVFDEMGLGKTVQALAYIKYHPECLPVLYVVKSGIKFQWFKEILRWLGDNYAGQIIQTSNDIVIPNLKTYIVSYDILIPKIRNVKGKQIQQGFDIEKFKKAGIKTMVLDECQLIKNPDSSRTQQIRRIAKDVQVIPLSGTPWKNRGGEFYPVLNMIAPTKFPVHQAFLDNWVDYYYDGKYYKQGGIRRVKEFKEYTKDIIIRRERSEVMKELPLISRTIRYCELEKNEQVIYDDEVSDFVKWWNEKVLNGQEDDFQTGGNILAKLARMRHLTGLAKIPVTVEDTKDFFEENPDKKLAVFVHHKDVGQIITGELRKNLPKDVEVIILTAELSSEERFKVQETFNNTKRICLVASTLASGEGLNLQTCADCIVHERQWNPANEEQVEGRFIRIGQVSTTVNSNYQTASGTVDEHLGTIVEKKRIHYHASMNKGEMPKWNQSDIIKELAQTIVDQHNKKNKILQFTKVG